jgi:hypothetical protein
MDDALKSLQFALDKYPERIELVPVEQLLVDSARQNEKRNAYIKLAVPDEMVKSVRGKLKDRDVVLLVRIPNEVLDRADSRIVLPGEVG